MKQFYDLEDSEHIIVDEPDEDDVFIDEDSNLISTVQGNELSSQSNITQKLSQKGKQFGSKTLRKKSVQKLKEDEIAKNQQRSSQIAHEMMVESSIIPSKILNNMKIIPKLQMSTNENSSSANQSTQNISQSITVNNEEQFLSQLSAIIVGEGDSRHLQSTSNSQRLAQLISLEFNIQSVETRLVIVKIMLRTMNDTILKKFIETNGLQVFNNWLVDIHSEIFRQNSTLQENQKYQIDLLTKDLIIKLIKVIKKFEIPLHIFKQVRVYNILNTIKGDVHYDEDIKCQANFAINKLREKVKNYKNQKAQEELAQMLAQEDQIQRANQFQQTLVQPLANSQLSNSQLNSQLYDFSVDERSVTPHTYDSSMDPFKFLQDKNARRNQMLEIFQNNIQQQVKKVDPQKSQQLKEFLKQKSILRGGLPVAIMKTEEKQAEQISTKSKVVQFKDTDENFIKIKYFKINDEPNAPGLSVEEVNLIQQELSETQCDQIEEKYKIIEMKMEKMKKAEIEEEERLKIIILKNMKPQINYIKYKLYIQKPLIDFEESKNQRKRENFLCPVNYTNEITTPDTPIHEKFILDEQNQTKLGFQPPLTCELECFSENYYESLRIIEKLGQIVTEFPQSIVENKDILVQILEKVEPEQREQLLVFPDYEREFIPQQDVTSRVQRLLCRLLLENYSNYNPIPYNFAQLPKETQKEIFMQAKEFYFIEQQKILDNQKQQVLQEIENQKIQQQFYQSQNLQSIQSMNQMQQLQTQQQPQIQQQQSHLKPKNYKTVPCRQYHGPEGCSRGDTCHFIHEPQYQGVDLPREIMMKIREENKLKNQQMMIQQQQQLQSMQSQIIPGVGIPQILPQNVLFQQQQQFPGLQQQLDISGQLPQNMLKPPNQTETNINQPFNHQQLFQDTTANQQIEKQKHNGQDESIQEMNALKPSNQPVGGYSQQTMGLIKSESPYSLNQQYIPRIPQQMQLQNPLMLQDQILMFMNPLQQQQYQQQQLLQQQQMKFIKQEIGNTLQTNQMIGGFGMQGINPNSQLGMMNPNYPLGMMPHNQGLLNNPFQTLPIAPHLGMNPMNPISNHPYLNPQFSKQYQQQEELQRKRQQEHQVMLMMAAHNPQANAAVLASSQQQPLNAPGSSAINPFVQQEKLMKNQETSEAHRRILEQIKEKKEKKLQKQREKEQRQQMYQQEFQRQQQQQQSGLLLPPPLPEPINNQKDHSKTKNERNYRDRDHRDDHNRSNNKKSSSDKSHQAEREREKDRDQKYSSSKYRNGENQSKNKRERTRSQDRERDRNSQHLRKREEKDSKSKNTVITSADNRQSLSIPKNRNQTAEQRKDTRDNTRVQERVRNSRERDRDNRDKDRDRQSNTNYTRRDNTVNLGKRQRDNSTNNSRRNNQSDQLQNHRTLRIEDRIKKRRRR
eukprot:403332689